MALNSPIVVRIEKNPERSFGETMNEIRIWLDHHNIHSISFMPVAKADRGLGLKSDSALRMRRSFSRTPSYHPTKRSDNLPERAASQASITCTMSVNQTDPLPNAHDRRGDAFQVGMGSFPHGRAGPHRPR
jgi:hypothetical protein